MALNINDPDVVELLGSRLWAAMLKDVCPEVIDAPRLLEELVKAKRYAADDPDDRRFNENVMDVNGAMTWDDTPQGHEFWQAINSAHNAVKRRNGD